MDLNGTVPSISPWFAWCALKQLGAVRSFSYVSQVKATSVFQYSGPVAVWCACLDDYMFRRCQFLDKHGGSVVANIPSKSSRIKTSTTVQIKYVDLLNPETITNI